jgi:hypothetical protein
MASDAGPEAMETLVSTRRKRQIELELPTNNKQSKSTESLSTLIEDNYSIPTTNAFSSLQQDAEEAQSSSQVAPQQLKKERVPTITIKWNIQLVKDQLQRANFRGDQYQIKLTSIGTVVKFSTVKDYQLFLKRCIDHQVPHFTHALASSKPVRFVLLGLPNLPLDDIATELASYKITPDEIKKTPVRNTRYEDHTNYLLYFQKGVVTLNQLRQIKSINSVIVRWMFYDSKRHGPTQCRKCQMWGHGSSNCHLSPKCVKCAGDHNTTDCTFSKKGEKVPQEQLKCANCHQQHSANFGGCERKKQYLLSRPAKKPANTQHQRTHPGFTIKNFPHLQHHQQKPHYNGNNTHLSYRDQLLLGNSNSYVNNTFKTFSSQNENFNSQMRNNIENHANLEHVAPSIDDFMSFYHDIKPILLSGKPRSDQFMMVFAVLYKHINGSP